MMRLTFLPILALLYFNVILTKEPMDEKSEDFFFKKPKIPNDAFFCLFFESENDLTEQLVKSDSKKFTVSEEFGKYSGEWRVEVPSTSAIKGDYALVLKSKAKHHAISSKLLKPIDFTRIPKLVVQYEVKFQNDLECGGAYIKLLTQMYDQDLTQFADSTPYSIMFGPDRCGTDNKLHFIIRHKNPVSGDYEEKHAKKPKGEFGHVFTDKKTHLYTLVLGNDNNFDIFVDQKLVNSGNLLSDLEPSIIPPNEIDDASDVKPSEWDDKNKVVDATAVKPEDWDETQVEMIVDESAIKPKGWLDDEPLLVNDPTSEKPTDWDTQMDGEWEPTKIDNPVCKDGPGCGPWKAPTIKNPLYKGKWSAPMIDNPNYKGKWKPKKIPNPDYFEDSNPFISLNSIDSLGMELWSMTDDIAFDNFVITSSKDDADSFAEETWKIKKVAELKADPSAQSVVDAVQEAVHDKPWIVAATLCCILIPTVLIIYFCCCRTPANGSDLNSQIDQNQTTYSKLRTDRDDDAEPEEDEKNAGSSGDVDNVNFDKADLESDDSESNNEDKEVANDLEMNGDAKEDEEIHQEKTLKKRVKKA